LKVDQCYPYFTGHAEFLETVFTNFNFEKLLLYEALVTGRVTATSNKQTQLLR